MIFDIIIVFLLLTFIVLNICFFFDIRKKIYFFRECAEKEIKKQDFIPYLAQVPNETQVYDDEKKPTHKTIKANSFNTIVFEDGEYCKILSGGWIKKEDIQEKFYRVERQIPARLKTSAFVFNGPSYSYKVITSLDRGSIIEINDEFGNWYKITFDKTTGYILKSTVEKI